MFDDEKIKLIRKMPEGERIVVIWVQMLCLAGKTNDNGSIYMGQSIYYTDEMLATLCDQPLNVMRIALKTLEQFGMIEPHETGMIEIVNWDKHQNVDGMEKIRLQNRERKKRFDLKKKAESLGIEPKGLPDNINELEGIVSNVTVTFGNATEEEEDKEEDKNIKSIKKHEAKAFFERVWKLYPLKRGKTSVSQTTKEKLLKEGFEAIEAAINNYQKELEFNDWQKMMNGSTFFNGRWQDYRPENFKAIERGKNGSVEGYDFTDEII